MRFFERDDVDDEVVAVRDCERAVLVSIERDVLDPVGIRPLALAGERQIPTVRRERVGDRRPDVAGAAEDEGAACDR